MKRLTNTLMYLAVFLMSAFFLNQILSAVVGLLEVGESYVPIGWYYATFPAAALISWRMGRRWFHRSALRRYFFCALFTALLADVVLVVGVMLLGQALSMLPDVRKFLTTRRGANVLGMLAVAGEILVVVVFAAVFSAMTGKKVRYINDISAKVTHMDELLPVKGDDEITHLSRSINQMWTELQEKRREEQRQSEMQTRMIGDISHDLRTPLTTIQGYVDLLKQDNALSGAERQEYLRIVQRKLNDLNAQINQLFDYTRLTQPDYRLQTQRVDAVAFFGHIASTYRLLMEQAGFTWRCSLPKEPAILEFDPQKLGQAIENLLENAKKYALPGTEISFSCALSPREMRLTIANRVDESIEESLPHIFERFYRADRARPTGGTGLGLPIVKKIVELHGGTIEAKYEGGVLAFDISIPRADNHL